MHHTLTHGTSRGRLAHCGLTCMAALLLGGCGVSQAEPRRDATTGPLAAPPAPQTNVLADKTAGQVEAATRRDTAAPSATAGDWPRWRGPLGGNLAPATALAADWPRGLSQPRWRVALGTGWSSPVGTDQRLIVTDRKGALERVLAFDLATGHLLWQCEHPVDFEPHPVGRNHGNGPKGTPLLLNGKVYSIGIAGWLECLDAGTGKRLWNVNFPAEFGRPEPLPDGRSKVVGTEHVLTPIGNGQGAPVPLFGYTGSLTATRRAVVASVGGARGGTLMAFDLETGHRAWQALDEEVSYSSPVVATLSGVEQVVALTGPRVVGLAADDGRLLWSHPFQIQYNESISTPTVAGDQVLITGDGHPLTALTIGRRESGWTCQVAWQNPDLTSYLSSMVVVDRFVYGMADDGQFACIDLQTGKTRWQGGDHGYHASPVAVGNRLVALNERGEILVVSAVPEAFHEVGRLVAAKGASWSVPAIVAGNLLVRAEGELICWGEMENQ